jgi:uncharacterized membrane protein YdjX (TVP38/TMEM64 family)
MTKYWKKILLTVLITVLCAVLFVSLGEVITLDSIKRHSATLQRFVEERYLLSVALFGLAMVTTAFFVPGALVLTVTGGYLFGAGPGTLYTSLFSTVGAGLAFLLSRYLIGAWVQEHYWKQMKSFNNEIARHGPNYLFVLRIVPVMPAFMLNYLSGMTRMSLFRFALFSFLGILPGALIYSMAGLQLKSIQAPQDLLSGRMLIGLSLLVLFSLSPALLHLVRLFIRTRTGRNKGPDK